MTTRKKPALGRNLSAMLSQSTLRHAIEQPAGASGGGDGSLRKISLDRIRPGPYQPRSVFEPESLQELADSISAQGVIQPITVRAVGEEFEIIAGERRWRAAQLAGLDQIPVIIRDVPDEVVVALALIENIQRENLNPLEEATALKRLVGDFQLTHAEAAKAVGRSRSTVSNLLRLLELSVEVRGMVDDRHLEMGHARALLSLPTAQQAAAAREVVHKQLSVRETEALVRRLLNPPKKNPRKTDPDVLNLQQELSEALCAKVLIRHGDKGRGSLVINYNSVDELEGIIGHLKSR